MKICMEGDIEFDLQVVNTAGRLNIATYVMPLDGWNAVFDYFPAQKRR